MKQAYLKYIASLLLFGSNGIVASCILLSSYEIVFLRTMIGSLLLVGLFALTTKRRMPLRKGNTEGCAGWCSVVFLTISGAAMGASWMFLYEAYQQIGVGIASLAYYCGPVIVMVLSPALFHERMTWPKIVGFLTVLCGICCINMQALHEGKTGWGVLCGLMSAVMYAFMVICNKKAAGVTGLRNAMGQLCISFVTVAVFVGIKQGFAIRIMGEDWLPILFLGMINTGIGCYFYFSSIGGLAVQTVAVCGYLEPLSAVVLSVLCLGETMRPVQIVGAALILGGALFAECVSARLTGGQMTESPCNR